MTAEKNGPKAEKKLKRNTFWKSESIINIIIDKIEIYYREKKKLGLCDDGKQYVDPKFLKVLVDMGYNKETARTALKKCNNIISDSVQYIQDNPGPSSTKSTEMMNLIEDLVPEVRIVWQLHPSETFIGAVWGKL